MTQILKQVGLAPNVSTQLTMIFDIYKFKEGTQFSCVYSEMLLYQEKLSVHINKLGI